MALTSRCTVYLLWNTHTHFLTNTLTSIQLTVSVSYTSQANLQKWGCKFIPHGEKLKHSEWEATWCSEFGILLFVRHERNLFSELILLVLLMSGWHKWAECQPNFWFVILDTVAIHGLVKLGIANQFQSLDSS